MNAHTTACYRQAQADVISQGDFAAAQREEWILVMDFIILPYRSAGPVNFGDYRDQVRSSMGAPPASFQKSRFDAFPADHFESEGVICYYDSEGRVEAVEFFSPARPFVNGVGLLGRSFKEAIEVLVGQDKAIEVEAADATCFELGIAVHAPLAKDDPSALVETVLAFRIGYFN